MTENSGISISPGNEPSELRIRSSAQGNCSAKSLAGNVVDSSLSSLSSGGGGHGGGGLGEGVGGEEGWGRGGGLGGQGEGAGDISSTLPYTALPHGASP